MTCPVRFFVFDVLRYDGKDITGRPYGSRRKRLMDIVASSSSSSVVRFPGSWTDIDPSTVLAATAELTLKGIVCKTFRCLRAQADTRSGLSEYP